MLQFILKFKLMLIFVKIVSFLVVYIVPLSLKGLQTAIFIFLNYNIKYIIMIYLKNIKLTFTFTTLIN